MAGIKNTKRTKVDAHFVLLSLGAKVNRNKSRVIIVYTELGWRVWKITKILIKFVCVDLPVLENDASTRILFIILGVNILE